jgi:hypothetical protein
MVFSDDSTQTVPSYFFQRQTLVYSVVKCPVHGTPVSIVPLAGEDPNVGMSEGSVAKCVAERVDCAVDVTQVIKEIPQFLGYAACTGSQWLEKHQDIIRGPRDYECKENC